EVYGSGAHHGLPYVALEFVEGGSLADRARGRPQPPCEAAHLVQALARGVQAAHVEGVVHRDLKPANVLLSGAWHVAGGEHEGASSRATIAAPLVTVPKITDFGLAKWLAQDRGLTGSGDVVGTTSYMAPEQAAGRGREAAPAE